MNKTFQWNGQKFPFSAMEAETARKFIPGAKKVAKELEDYEKNTVGVGNLLSADDIIAELQKKCFRIMIWANVCWQFRS